MKEQLQGREQKKIYLNPWQKTKMYCNIAPAYPVKEKNKDKVHSR